MGQKPIYIIVHRSQIEDSRNYYTKMIASMKKGKIPFLGANQKRFEVGLRETETVLGEIERLIKEEETVFFEGDPLTPISGLDKSRSVLVGGGLYQRDPKKPTLCVDGQIKVLREAGYNVHVYPPATLSGRGDGAPCLQLSKIFHLDNI